MNIQLLAEWQALKKHINKMNKMYRAGQPMINDQDYDILMARFEYLSSILNMQQTHARDIIDAQRTKIKHTLPMLSIDHGFGEDAINQYIKRLENICNPFPMIGEHKVDGIAISIIYKNHKIHELRTRGNGIIGNQINDRIPMLDVPMALCIKNDIHFDNINKNIHCDNIIEVRGEAFMTNENFNIMSSDFASPRNAAAAAIQSITKHMPIQLSFMPYNVFNSQHTFKTYIEKVHYLQQIGFVTQPYTILNGIDECIEYYKYTTQNRALLPYCIDGAVFKINDLLICEAIGYTQNAPRYIFAAKFDRVAYPTQIRNIQFQVGKHGVITPVAIFDTILIDGCSITKSSLHNCMEHEKQQYGIGDIIQIARAGDTIPYIVKKTHHANTHISLQECPSCSSVLVKYQQSLRCMKGWKCPQQRLLRILHFTSRDAFNIAMLGQANLQMLIDESVIEYPCDILTIPSRFMSGEIIHLPNFGNKSIQNLMQSILNLHNTDLQSVIYSLGIPSVGKSNALTIAKYYQTLDNFLHNFNPSQKLTNIGTEISQDIYDFLHNPDELWVYSIPHFLADIKSCTFIY
jgi:DNA ligase (NAD+)